MRKELWCWRLRRGGTRMVGSPEVLQAGFNYIGLGEEHGLP